MSGVIGIDLSLRRAAAVYLPPRWEPGSWEGVAWKVAGYPVEGKDRRLQQRRIVDVAHDFLEFAERRPDAKIFIEDYAWSIASSSVLQLAEMRGAILLLFGQFDRFVEPINMMTARKTFLGKLPQGKGKAQAAVHAAIQRMKPPWGEGSDEGDSWCIANAGRSLLGLTAATLA